MSLSASLIDSVTATSSPALTTGLSVLTFAVIAKALRLRLRSMQTASAADKMRFFIESKSSFYDLLGWFTGPWGRR